MAYTTGIINSANCAMALSNTIGAALTTAGFALVESYSAGGTNLVYKSPGASNAFGQDWYLIIRRTSDNATGVLITVTENYSPTTHLLTNYVPATTVNNSVPVQTAGVNLYAFDDATGVLPTSTNVRYVNMTADNNSSTYYYFMSASINRLILGTTGSTTDTVYAGLYDDLLPSAMSKFPLVVTNCGGSGSTAGGATREPGQSLAHTGNFQIPPAGLVAWSQVTQEMYTGSQYISRGVVSSGRNTATAFRGMYRDCWIATSNGVNGDTLTATINGESQILVKIAQWSPSRFWANKAAA